MQNPIEYLVRSRFGEEAHILKTLQRYAPEGTQKMSERIRALENFKAELSSLQPSEIERLVIEQEQQSREQSREALRKEEMRHVFNAPFADLATDQISFWSKAGVWTLEEAIALAFGKNPKFISAERMASSRRYLTCVRNYNTLHELIKRGVTAGELSDPIKPIHFLDWMAQKKIPTSEAVEAEVRALHTPSRSDRKANLLPRERESIHKLIIGMAIACYKHDPKATRSKTASSIVTDLLQIGISINEDTVHSWLKQAAAVLPE